MPRLQSSQTPKNVQTYHGAREPAKFKGLLARRKLSKAKAAQQAESNALCKQLTTHHPTGQIFASFPLGIAANAPKYTHTHIHTSFSAAAFVPLLSVAGSGAAKPHRAALHPS